MQTDKEDVQANQEATPPSRPSTRLVDERVIPVAEEILRTHVRSVAGDEVHVRTTVEESVEQVDAELEKTTVSVRRVPMNRIVERPLPVRTEGDTTIIPVLEERVVVRTEWVLVEEVHVERTRKTVPERHEVALRKTHVDVERRSSPQEAR